MYPVIEVYSPLFFLLLQHCTILLHRLVVATEVNIAPVSQGGYGRLFIQCCVAMMVKAVTNKVDQQKVECLSVYLNPVSSLS
jgi:hypothetical protein